MRKSILLLIFLLFTTSVIQADVFDDKDDDDDIPGKVIDKNDKFGIYGGITRPNISTEFVEQAFNERICYDRIENYGLHMQSFYAFYLNKYLDLEVSIGYNQKVGGYSKYLDALYRKPKKDKVSETIVTQTFHHLRCIIPQLNIYLFPETVKARVVYIICGAYIDYIMSVTSNKKFKVLNKLISSEPVTKSLKPILRKSLDYWNFGLLFGAGVQFETGVMFKFTVDIGIQPIYDLDIYKSPAFMFMIWNVSVGYNFGSLLDSGLLQEADFYHLCPYVGIEKNKLN